MKMILNINILEMKKSKVKANECHFDFLCFSINAGLLYVNV